MFGHEAVLEGDVEGCLERRHCVLDAQRRLLGQVIGQVPGPVVDLGFRDDLGDEVTPLGLLEIDVLAGQDEPLRLADPDDMGESLGRPLVRKDAEVHLDDAVLGPLAQHAEVGRKRQFEVAISSRSHVRRVRDPVGM